MCLAMCCADAAVSLSLNAAESCSCTSDSQSVCGVVLSRLLVLVHPLVVFNSLRQASCQLNHVQQLPSAATSVTAVAAAAVCIVSALCHYCYYCCCCYYCGLPLSAAAVCTQHSHPATDI
eukprot:19180-Heterococcus_DN1.PRE.3